MLLHLEYEKSTLAEERDTHEWWQEGIIYQIYPRSFNDSNGDGVGDLPGIIDKLGYLEELGISAIWISPIYPSPMADFGYDVSDHTDIHPMFGTMEDFDRLVEEVHRRGFKLILDYVPNHTSEEHPWFLESRQSRDNPKRDWYIWRDPKPDGSRPTNWQSIFGGSGWEYDEKTGQYYYHTFLKEQPDLNWRNPEVQKAMMDVMRFWLSKGVDGFRVDAIWHVIKDDQFRDDPKNPDYKRTMTPYDKHLPVYSADRPEIHDVIRMMREAVDGYGEKLLIGEFYLPTSKLVEYHRMDGFGVHLPFNFQLIGLPWKARHIEELVNEYEDALPTAGWPNWVLGNHDRPRIASRVGPEQARVAAILLLTLRGTPTMYYGDELGMTDVSIPEEMVMDPLEKNVPGYGLGRDPVRTPMQWDSSENAGFTEGAPWLPLMDDFEEVNVAEQSEDSDSMLNLYRRLIELRSGEPALKVGGYEPMSGEEGLFSFRRVGSDKEFLIVLNLRGRRATYTPDSNGWKGVVRLSTHGRREGEELDGEIGLKANQGLVIEVL